MLVATYWVTSRNSPIREYFTVSANPWAWTSARRRLAALLDAARIPGGWLQGPAWDSPSLEGLQNIADWFNAQPMPVYIKYHLDGNYDRIDDVIWSIESEVA